MIQVVTPLMLCTWHQCFKVGRKLWDLKIYMHKLQIFMISQQLCYHYELNMFLNAKGFYILRIEKFHRCQHKNMDIDSILKKFNPKIVRVTVNYCNSLKRYIILVTTEYLYKVEGWKHYNTI